MKRRRDLEAGRAQPARTTRRVPSTWFWLHLPTRPALGPMPIHQLVALARLDEHEATIVWHQRRREWPE